VEDIAFVNVQKSVGHLIDVPSSQFFLQFFVFLQLFVEFSSGRVFHNVVHFPLVVEETEHFEDVWVVEVGVDFDLAADLPDHIGVDDLLF
jgi:hypothetical protein